jgi:RNA polymerase sigma factor (sigma-70 family)
MMNAMPAPDPVRDALVAHRDELIGFVRKRAGHLVDPEDVVHRAAARALGASGSLREPARARAWLFRITRNELTDELRKLGVPAAPLPADEDLADPDPQTFSDGRPCQCGLDIAKKLKPEYASILERAVLDDVAVIDVAKELGITANNAMVRLHRARKALRAAIVDRCGTDSIHECMDCNCDASGACCATR